MCAFTKMFTPMQKHAHTHTSVYIYIHGLTYTHAMHTHINACLHMWAHAGTHAHAYIRVVHTHVNGPRNDCHSFLLGRVKAMSPRMLFLP